jgi:hypothetical protein
MIGELGENVVITEDHMDGFKLGEEAIDQFIDDGFDRMFEISDQNGEVHYTGLLFEDSDDENEPLDLVRIESGCTEIEYVPLPERLPESKNTTKYSNRY